MVVCHSLLSQGLAGIQAVNIEGVENVRICASLSNTTFSGFEESNCCLAPQIDVTDLIEGHSSYLWATQQILEQLELDTYYPVFRILIKP